ncbi:hypothetical protein CDD81_556 [Ophiocordyceps australis]|uniref:Zn(2)-C6 fungal-type domain-containing protein n=1 Tax=Ophiocordyceps australis TaxID=1399860 RepID=A0A2C5YGL0_9HYPO|nr:hypothetical protein CDD81_556 [Ophiocordyceps australis]
MPKSIGHDPVAPSKLLFSPFRRVNKGQSLQLRNEHIHGASPVAMNRPWQPILPAPGNPNEPALPNKVPRTPRYARPNACLACRLKKIRCDGHRPKCGSCAKRQDLCVYKASRAERRSEQDIHEIIHQLKNAPPMEALELLQRLRASKDPGQAASAMNGRAHGRHCPSALQAARAVSPPSFCNFEFELMAKHQFAYPALLHADVTAMSLKPLQTLHVHTCPSWTALKGILAGQMAINITGPDQAVSSCLAPKSPSGAEQSLPLFGPRRLQLCDDRLHALCIRYWTGVPISDSLAASIISNYLEVMHPVLGFFDADLFLQDLLSYRQGFCSPFLVEALLSIACLCIMDILEDIALMAKRMNLLDVRYTASMAALFSNLSPESKLATAHVAWGAYNWLTINSFYGQIKPLLYPPVLPIPGQHHDWTRDQELNTMWPPHPLPHFCGKTFTALCKLWQIMQEVGSVYFADRLVASQDKSTVSNCALSFAESKFQKLLAMTDSFSPELSQQTDNVDHHIVLQYVLYCPTEQVCFDGVNLEAGRLTLRISILVHNAIIDIFQPFIDKESETQSLPSFASSYSSAQTAFRASIKQLQRLMLICRWQNPRVLAMVSTNTALVHVSNAMLRDAAIQAATLSSNEYQELLDQNYDKEWRSYFFLCLSNCQVSAMCFPAFKSICRGLLAMAMRDGIMDCNEAHSWMTAIDEHTSRAADGTVRFGSHPTDESGDNVHGRAANGKSEEWTTFQELTLGNDYIID